MIRTGMLDVFLSIFVVYSTWSITWIGDLLICRDGLREGLPDGAEALS